MEDNYPEIALKQPKSDPRTVLLFKRNSIESIADHTQHFYSNSIINKSTSTTVNTVKTKNMCKCSSIATKTAFLPKISLESVSTSSTTFKSSLPSPSASSTCLMQKISSTTSSLLSWSTVLLSSTLAFIKSCQLNASFINYYLCKTQKTKLIFFQLFIWCAIFLQVTEAAAVHRRTTTGSKLILHTNVYKERYHHNLLEEQRQHNQRQQLMQLQLQEKRQQPQPLVEYQNQQQVQKIHRHPLVLPNHRHHLHQRAAPGTSTHYYFQANKMSYCSGNKIYNELYTQMNASMSYIKQLCANYLRDRGNETYEDMSETWKLISLETTNPNRKEVSIENELHQKIHEFYLNLHTFDQLIDYASQDTNVNKTKIEHGEEISIDKIIKFLQLVKAEIKFNMKETENLLEILEIEKPNLADNAVQFNYNISRRIRDFLIIKNLIEEFEHVIQLVQDYCESNKSE